MNLHFDPLDFDSPGIRGLVEGRLHHGGDRLPLRQDVAQVLRTQDVSEESKHTGHTVQIARMGW